MRKKKNLPPKNMPAAKHRETVEKTEDWKSESYSQNQVSLKKKKKKSESEQRFERVRVQRNVFVMSL